MNIEQSLSSILMSTDNNKQIIIGRIGSVYGLKGWLKIISFTEPVENIFSYQPWQLFIHHQWQPVSVKNFNKQGTQLIALLDICTNREDTRQYTGLDISIFRQQLPTLSNNEYYWSDLEGLKVVNKEGYLLGTVDHLFATGSNDVLVVIGNKKYLIPYLLNQFILHIDLNNQTMLVDWDPDF